MQRAILFLAQRMWLQALLIGVAYFLMQLSFISQYGVSWDEPLHRSWGELLWMYWQSGEKQYIDSMPGYGMYYGPLYYFVNFLLSSWLYEHGWMSFVAANHMLNIATASAGVSLVFLLGRALGTWLVAFSAVAFFVLYPQFIAHAQYNPKDIPLMVSILLTSLLFLRALQSGSRLIFALSGLAFGLSFALKVSALLMAPVFGITYIVWLCRRHGFFVGLRKEWLTIFCTTVAFLFGAYLFWPSAWLRPSLILQSLSLFTGAEFWPGDVLFFGQVYAAADLPWYYTPLEYAMATPLLLLLFFIVGTRNVFGRALKGKDTILLFLLLWVFFPLLVSLKPGLVRYDGIRQFFFILPAIILLAAIGFQRLSILLQQRAKRKRTSSVFAALVLFSLISEVFLLHPFEGSYRNEIVRAVFQREMNTRLEIENWGPTYKQGIEWLSANAKQDAVVCVPIAELLVSWYPVRPDVQFACSPKTMYLMYFTRHRDANELKKLQSEPVFRLRRMNADLLKIYEVQ